MNQAPRQPHDQLLDRIEALARERLPEPRAGLAADFVRQYYARTRLDLLRSRDPLDLYGAALAHLALARQRRPGESRIRVYNPALEDDGWECPHTVVQLVGDDQPFLVDSVRMAVNRRDLAVLRVIHPVMRVRRDSDGVLTAIEPRTGGDADTVLESVIHLEIVRQTDPATLSSLETALDRVLDDVRLAVQDWQPMREALQRAIAGVEAKRPPLPETDVEESLAFLRWLADDHFTFLGYRAYDLVDEDGETTLRIVPGSGLGILRERGGESASQAFAGLPEALRSRARRPALLVMTKASARSTVQRPANLDYIGVKRLAHDGTVLGEHRFLGLYGSRAYNRLPQEIPLLRRKVAAVIERADLDPQGHSARALAHILETYPRDELFQADVDDLYRIATGIMQLAEEQRPRLFVREDPYARFVTCLVYAPRERYDTRVRQRMQRIFAEAFDATDVAFSVSLSESALARILFTVRIRPGALPDYDADDIERRLADAVLTWGDHLQTALVEHLGEERGNVLHRLYCDAFPAGYREDFQARSAVRDIEHLEGLDAGHELRLSLYAPLEAEPGRLRFKVFRHARPMPLSRALPILENMGVEVEDERPYRVDRRGGPPLWVHDFGLVHDGGEMPGHGDMRLLFEEAFAAVWQGRVEDDAFNRLVVKARLDWRRVALLRAYARYLRQAGVTFSQAYMAGALAANPGIAARLAGLFEARFDPARRDDAPQREERLTTGLRDALEAVESLDQDRILRAFLSVIDATVRTNWYQRADGVEKPYTALKLCPERIPELPEPRPMFEIFVYSPRTEGVHLRGGRVARGGLRWSDRLEDFRTEVLGLMKAQMVKNAIIVPVGAKGGFVVKHPPGDRDALRAEVIRCYRQFIAGLLDLTDNLDPNGVVPPPELVRYDADDPYLVVAADKGTATLSDTANEVAALYGFWLGDAFASGGATGYDHKKMGITARGTWECVRQHFQAAGIAYETDTFSVIGIGDMSGDVFGNGLLWSDRIRLIAAFDHRHVFIDPDPDPATAFAERKRLFALPGSSWDDYDRARISDGGGVYPRSLKSIRLTEAACRALDCEPGPLTPNELVRVLLRAPVDLLWNGGIGTYVRARSERDSDVGDRGNDAVRVTADALRCRVIGEGGNLGLTQCARIEYARLGGRCDTDFIHNAGGVSCSDHEVNIKILLDQVVADGELTVKQRNRLLGEMTDEVAQLVLQDCYWQGRAIGLDEYRCRDLLAEHARLIRALEQRGQINRGLEYLPDDDALGERAAAGAGLTRPEIAILVSYAKHTLYESLLASDLLEQGCLVPELERYFPTALRQRFSARLADHRLRREILASTLANRLVNRMGSTFVFRLQEDLDIDPAAAVASYLVAWEVFDMRRLWSAVAELDNRVNDMHQRAMLVGGVRLVARASRWLLRRDGGRIDILADTTRYRDGIAALAEQLPEVLDAGRRDAMEAEAAPLIEAGTPPALARWVAGFDTLVRGLDIVSVASACEIPVRDAADLYFGIGHALELDWLAHQIGALPSQDRWLSAARAALRDELLEHHRRLSVAVLHDGPADASTASLLADWRARHDAAIRHWLDLLTELRPQESPDVARLSVALRAVGRLAATAAEPG